MTGLTEGEAGGPVMTPAAVVSVLVTVSCPACGADGYEVDFDADDIRSAVMVSLPCDECPTTITVDADVHVQSKARTEARA